MDSLAMGGRAEISIGERSSRPGLCEKIIPALVLAVLASPGAACTEPFQPDAVPPEGRLAMAAPNDPLSPHPATNLQLPTGLASLELNRPCPGFTLFSTPAPNAERHQVATLVDMEGRMVHQWTLFGMPVKMLPGGDVIGSRRNRPGPGTVFQDAVELAQESWAGVEQWSFSRWDDGGTGQMMSRQHHDFQREGNPVGYYAPGQDSVPRGRTLVLGHLDYLVPAVSQRVLQDDVIYEVDWQGNVLDFQWKAVDHIHEMGFDHSALEAIYQGLKYDSRRGTADWLHINSMSRLGRNRWFEEENDQRFHPDNIIISSREANFIAIIHHETGKIVWRVGPDFSEGTPEHDLGQFVGQHHAHMVPYGLPGAGNILVFDNGGVSGYGGPSGYPRYSRLYSRVIEFNPVTLEMQWTYGAPSGTGAIYSFFLSSVQRLPNGNTLITAGSIGMILEVSPSKVVVWSYVSPYRDKAGNNYLYRAYRIPPEWVPKAPGLEQYPPWSVSDAEDDAL